MKIYVYIESGKCNIVDGNFRFQYNAAPVEEKVKSMNIIQLEAPGDNEIIRFIYACASLCKCVYITLTVLYEDITLSGLLHDFINYMLTFLSCFVSI